MTTYRKDVYNLAPGLGQAIDDPRVGEELARNADARAAQELALRRQAQAQQQALAQRQMALSEQAASFEQNLASQARGGATPAYGDGQAAAPAGRTSPRPVQGRDAQMREANNAAAQQKQFNYQMNAGLDLDRVFGQATSDDEEIMSRGSWREPTPTGDLVQGGNITGRLRGGNAGYNRGGGVTYHRAAPREQAPPGEVFQAGRMSADDAMAEALGLEDRALNRNMADRKMSMDEYEGRSIDQARADAASLGRDTLAADVEFKNRGQTEVERQNNWQRSFTEKESLTNWSIRRQALALEAQQIKTAQDAQKWQQKFTESEAMRQQEQRVFERMQTSLNNATQRDVTLRQADREDTAQSFQIEDARRVLSDADRQMVYQFLTSDEDILDAINSGEVSSEAAIKLEMFRNSSPRYGQMLDAILGGQNIQETARDAGHSVFRSRDRDSTLQVPFAQSLRYTDREMEPRAQNRFNRGMGVNFPQQPEPSPRWGSPDLGKAAGQVKDRLAELIFGPRK